MMGSRTPTRALKRATGVLTNAPLTKAARGYGFVTLDEGGTVYCPKAVIRKAGASGDDIGRRVEVAYVNITSHRLSAARLSFIDDEEEIDADLQKEMDEMSDKIDAAYDAIDALVQVHNAIYAKLYGQVEEPVEE